MFGVGIAELIVIMIIAFVVVGPEKLPQIARALGKGIFELKRATEGIREEIEQQGDQLGEVLEGEKKGRGEKDGRE
jgi:Tat protein translocase TatB subunit